MVFRSHWQFLKTFQPFTTQHGIMVSSFDIWKANELRHAQIGKITMKPKA